MIVTFLPSCLILLRPHASSGWCGEPSQALEWEECPEIGKGLPGLQGTLGRIVQLGAGSPGEMSCPSGRRCCAVSSALTGVSTGLYGAMSLWTFREDGNFRSLKVTGAQAPGPAYYPPSRREISQVAHHIFIAWLLYFPSPCHPECTLNVHMS